MMNRVQTTLAAAVLIVASAANAAPIVSAADAALNNATVVDFESASGYAASFDMGAVTFKTLGGGSLSIQSHGNQYGTSGQSLNNQDGQAFEAVFDNTVSAFGIMGGAVNTRWTYTAYDTNNTVLEILNLNDPCCSGYFHGIAANGIKRVTFSGPGDWVTFDNFRFTATEVPEPGSLALLGVAMAGFAVARRKKA